MSTPLIDEYKPWTPSMVRETRFSDQRGRGRKGYERAEVDAFVTRISDEIAYLHGRIENLTAQLETARMGVEAVATGEINVYESVDEQAIALRMQAQDEANKIVDEAGQMADDIVAEANTQADEIIASANDHGAMIVARAQQIANEIEPPEPTVPDDLPAMLDLYERVGEQITAEVERLEQDAARARERLTAATDGVRRTLVSGARTTQQSPSRGKRASSSPSIPGEDGEPILTPERPGHETTG